MVQKQRQNQKGFLHQIMMGDEKWIHYYDNSKHTKSCGKPGHASTSTAKPNIHGKKLILCIWRDQQPTETITGVCYQQQLSRALKLKRPQYAKRYIAKHTCYKSHQGNFEGTLMGCPTPPALFTKDCSFRLPLIPINDSWPGWTALHFLQKSQKFLDRLERRGIFSLENSYAAWKMVKSRKGGKYFE